MLTLWDIYNIKFVYMPMHHRRGYTVLSGKNYVEMFISSWGSFGDFIYAMYNVMFYLMCCFIQCELCGDITYIHKAFLSHFSIYIFRTVQFSYNAGHSIPIIAHKKLHHIVKWEFEIRFEIRVAISFSLLSTMHMTHQ